MSWHQVKRAGSTGQATRFQHWWTGPESPGAPIIKQTPNGSAPSWISALETEVEIQVVKVLEPQLLGATTLISSNIDSVPFPLSCALSSISLSLSSPFSPEESSFQQIPTSYPCLGGSLFFGFQDSRIQARGFF